MHKELLSLIILLILAASRNTTADILLWSIFPIGFCIAVYIREKQNTTREKFINQLKSHREDLRKGGTVVVDQQLLRYSTVLTTYQMTVGGVLTSIDIPSNYSKASQEQHIEGLLFSLVSMATGWWAFPAGPIITLTMIINNLSGGEKTTVALLIDKDLIDKKRKSRKDNLAKVAKFELDKKLKEIEDRKNYKPVNTGKGSPSARLVPKSGKFAEPTPVDKLSPKKTPAKTIKEQIIEDLQKSIKKHSK